MLRFRYFVSGTLIFPLLIGLPTLSSARAESASNPSLRVSGIASRLLSLTRSCNEITYGRYKKDEEASSEIPICKLRGAIFWRADMDIDCDGQRTSACNEKTDDSFQNQTSAVDSKGNWLNAALLPYVVIPLPSHRFNYKSAGLRLGDVVAVIYKRRLVFGVFGDEGPEDIIGEGSYAMAKSLGINPDPRTGGTDGPVTYIAFPGHRSKMRHIENGAEARQKGAVLVRRLLK